MCLSTSKSRYRSSGWLGRARSLPVAARQSDLVSPHAGKLHANPCGVAVPLSSLFAYCDLLPPRFLQLLHECSAGVAQHRRCCRPSGVRGLGWSRQPARGLIQYCPLRCPPSAVCPCLRRTCSLASRTTAS